MITAESMHVTQSSDAELVAECRRGNRDAFREIVVRHQTLVCSVAYSATGSVSRSEDLAQETFVTAWKQLAALREPAKLRAWLCGIARFMIERELRQRRREPLHTAESLDAADGSAAPEPLPSERAVTEEEKALLWHALERIPATYREPLVLFYREHQSIERVAGELDLGEDAVRQRLSRGRKYLHDEVLALVEGTLADTAPGESFSLGVVAALPLIATGAGVASAGGMAVKGTTAKSVTTFAALGAMLTAGLIVTFSLMGFLVFMGTCLGLVMSRASARSARLRANLARCWRAIAVAGAVLGIVPFVAAAFVPGGAKEHPEVYTALTWWMTLLYPTIAVVVARWFWQWRQDTAGRQSAPVNMSATTQPSLGRWLALGMLAPGCCFAIFVYATAFQMTYTGRFLPPDEARKIISERHDASYLIYQYRSGRQSLRIKLPEDGRRVAYFTPADATALALLAKNGITPSTVIQGRDYEQLGWPGRSLGLLALFIVPMGVMIAGRAAGRHKFASEEATVSVPETRTAKIFACCAVIAAGLTGFAIGIALITMR